MSNSRLDAILFENDRSGERAIAFFQALVALIVFAFHIASATTSQWETLSTTTLFVAVLILCACLIRFAMSNDLRRYRKKLHFLTIVDGALIFMLIVSYSSAYDLPLETSFKAPSAIFLMVYTAIRLLKSDPVPILIAAATVLSGWFGLLFFSFLRGANVTNSYFDYVTGPKVLIGAVIEIAVGYILIVAVLIIVTITARKFLKETAHIEDLSEAKDQAEQSLNRMNSIINSSTDGILIVQSDGIISRANPALEKIFGFPASELVGQSAAMLMSSQNAERLRLAIQQFIETGQNHIIGQVFESEGINSKGKIVPIELSINEFQGRDVRSFAAFIRDISERKQIAENERKALARFEDAVQAAMDAIIIIDKLGNVISFNPAAEAIFGYTQAELLGKNMSRYIVPPAHRKAHQKGMKHYLKTGHGPVLNNRIEIEGLRKDGTIFDLELAIKDIDGPTGKLFIGYARDISQRKMDELALQEAKAKAEAASQAKASFLAEMSHEIRTPLNGVLGLLKLLEEEELTQQQRKYVSTAGTSGRALLNVVNDVLDFSKLEAGRMGLEMIPFLIEPLVDSVISVIDVSARAKDLQLVQAMAPDVSPAFIGDPDRIRQVLLNLASNAVKFTKNGTITISVSKHGDITRIAVKDTGIGIHPDKHDQLFAEFATLDASYARKFGGTGLGLAICKNLVEAMGGTVHVESEEGKGSKFWFDIPLEIADEKTLIEPESGETAAMEKSSFKVMVAEDNATNQLVISHHLKRLGCSVHIVSDGQEAVSICNNERFDFILMDISMPIMDGLDATRTIRQGNGTNKKTPIIALTAYALDEDRERVLTAGMNDFLTKPVDRSELIKAIKRQTSGKADAVRTYKTKAEFDAHIEQIKSIFDEMQPDEIALMIEKCKEDLARYEAVAQQALKENDLIALERASHGLKGIAGIFGFASLTEISTSINTKCREQGRMTIPGQAKKLTIYIYQAMEQADEVRAHFTLKSTSKHEG